MHNNISYEQIASIDFSYIILIGIVINSIYIYELVRDNKSKFNCIMLFLVNNLVN